MAERTAITVVVPTHNRSAVMARTVRAILDQRDVDVRLVVVDDASSDGTRAVLERIAEDDRCEVVFELDPVGPAVARNHGAARAGTELVAFCDDDDLWAPTKLAQQVAALDAHPECRWSCTGAITLDPTAQILGHQRLVDDGDVIDRLRGVDIIPGGASSVVVERSLFDEVGGFDPSLASAHDWELWIRFAERSPVAGVDEPLVGYRVWPGSMSWDVQPMERAYHQTIHLHSPHPFGSVERRQADSDFDRYMARMELRNGDRRAVAKRHARLARRLRAPKDLVHAVISFVAPGPTERWRSVHERRQIPEEWVAFAEAWLSELPDSAVVSTSS